MCQPFRPTFQRTRRNDMAARQTDHGLWNSREKNVRKGTIERHTQQKTPRSLRRSRVLEATKIRTWNDRTRILCYHYTIAQLCSCLKDDAKVELNFLSAKKNRCFFYFRCNICPISCPDLTPKTALQATPSAQPPPHR